MKTRVTLKLLHKNFHFEKGHAWKLFTKSHSTGLLFNFCLQHLGSTICDGCNKMTSDKKVLENSKVCVQCNVLNTDLEHHDHERTFLFGSIGMQCDA